VITFIKKAKITETLRRRHVIQWWSYSRDPIYRISGYSNAL